MNQFKKLSIIVPVYNEEMTLRKLISTVEEVDLPFEKEIILVDDGSTDGTREILKMMSGHCKVIFQDKNEGKGLAVKRGFEVATGDIVLIQDADLEYNPQDYYALTKPIVDGVADVVYGSRFLESGRNNTIVYRHGYLFSRVSLQT